MAVAALTLGYRTRYEYMTHWAAMRSGWTGRAAKDFDEPTWLPTDKTPKPWIVDKAVTAEETEAAFREGLQYFRPTPVKEIAFSNDLVPAGLTGVKAAASVQSYQRPAYYAVHSTTGEPIELEITPGVIAWYRDRADARYRLRDAEKKIVAEGTLKLDGE